MFKEIEDRLEKCVYGTRNHKNDLAHFKEYQIGLLEMKWSKLIFLKWMSSIAYIRIYS